MKALLKIAILVLIAVGCTNEETERREVVYIERWDSHTFAIVDPYTGVNYIVYSHAQGVSMMPRFNADGTLYTDK